MSALSDYYENKFSQANQGVERLIGDQALISSLTPHSFINDLCPEGWLHLVRKKDYQTDLSKAKIAIFRKSTSKPSKLPDHPLVKKHWR